MKLYSTTPLVAAILLIASNMAVAQIDPDAPQEFEIGDRVELYITGSNWQSCVVTENDPRAPMRLRCQPYANAAGFTRAGGSYMAYSRKPNEVRQAPQQNGGAANNLPAGAYANPQNPNQTDGK